MTAARPSDAPGYLFEAAERWGTPLYVTDLDVAARHLNDWQAAFPGALVAYAMKANADPQLLRRLVNGGAGVEVVTAVELSLARRAGCPPERLVMNGVGKRDEEIHLALEAGALVNAESFDELDVLLRLATGHDAPRLGLRLNPGLGAATHPHLATGAAASKFGIPMNRLPDALGRFAQAGLPLESLGAHIGSAIESAAPYRELAARLADASSVAAAEGQAPRRLNLGGGPNDAEPATLAEVAAAVAAHLTDTSRLILEPGRSLVADAGWLITRVVRVQPRPEQGCTYLVADAGMTELIRPMLYGASHPLALLRAGGAVPGHGSVHLAGPVCEAGDILVHDAQRWLSADELATAGAGTLLAIGQAGAYGAVMASGYNGRLRPAEVVVEGGVPRLSRRRETLDDLVSRDVAPASAHPRPDA